jgi:acyl-CoA reductase-like NAD-dependent aldehyde dehydrogenase
MWTFPIAVVMGNCFILKPSEKVPLTMQRVAALMEQAGFPKGVFGMVQGTKDAVQALIRHPNVAAVTFVGSSPVADLVSGTCRGLGKRCTSLGGAKNHLVALPDCDAGSAASDICVSFAGCAGQRCMAASVLLTAGPHPDLVSALVGAASALEVRWHPSTSAAGGGRRRGRRRCVSLSPFSPLDLPGVLSSPGRVRVKWVP